MCLLCPLLDLPLVETCGVCRVGLQVVKSANLTADSRYFAEFDRSRKRCLQYHAVQNKVRVIVAAYASYLNCFSRERLITYH